MIKNKIPETYIDWSCYKCGFFHETNIGNITSYPCECPKCKENSTRLGFPNLPVNRTWCDSEPKQYSLISGEKKIQVYLISATGERTGHAMDPDWVPDCDDDPIYVAEQVLEICKTKYIYCSSTKDVERVLNAMKNCEALSNENEKQNKINKLRKSIICDIQEYNDLIN